MDVYKTVTVETLEIEKRKWFRREVSIVEVETKHKLKPTNLDFGYKYSFKNTNSTEYITEHYIIKLDNIHKIFYNKDIHRFTIFFTYDIFDYIRIYNSDKTDESDYIGVEDVTDLDLDDYMEIDNIFTIDLIKYFERNQINLNYSKEDLEKEIQAYRKRHKEKKNNKIKTTRKSIKINKIN